MGADELGSESDEALVKAFVDSADQQALEVLLRRHESRVLGLAFRTLGNRPDALDVTQDVFLSVFRRAKSFKHRSAFSTWLYRLTINACHDHARQKARSPAPVEPVEGHSADSPDAFAASDDRMAVHDALQELIPEQRTAVVMRDIYQMSYEEIAAATGTPAGTVRSRIARGRISLAKKLSGTVGSPGTGGRRQASNGYENE